MSLVSDDKQVSEINETDLGQSRADAYAMAARSALGALPFVGPAIGEVVSTLIPNQRLDRIETFLKGLENRLSHLEQEQISELFNDDEKVRLFEDGAQLSAKARNRNKIDGISRIVSDGIQADTKAAIESARILELVDQVDDDQIIILMSKLLKYWNNDDFRDKNASILNMSYSHMQSTRSELDAAVQAELSRDQLVSMGLLSRKIKNFKKGELPEIDRKSGLPKSSGTEITPLGRLLLRRLNFADEDDV